MDSVAMTELEELVVHLCGAGLATTAEVSMFSVSARTRCCQMLRGVVTPAQCEQETSGGPASFLNRP